MKSKELLQKAKTEFVKEFGQTHKECGYTFVFPWKKNILFTHNKKETLAYIKSQYIFKSIIIILIICALIMITCFALHSPIQTFYVIGSIGLLLLSILFGIRLNYVNICKNKILIYEAS